MDTHPNTPPARASYHPLMILAAIAVVLFCLVGTAAIMGWLPSSIGGTANRQLSDADRMALAAGMQQPGTPAPALPAVQPQPYAAQPLAPAYPAQPAAAVAPAYPAQALVRAPDTLPAAGAPATRPVQLAAAEPSQNWCSNCGNIESIRTITTRARGSGIGAAGGAVLGGLLGNQIGGGHGRQLATVAGAVGGAVMGNQVEGNMKATTSYEIRVRLDDGTLRTFHQHSAPAWHNGDRVRIVKGSLRRA